MPKSCSALPQSAISHSLAPDRGGGGGGGGVILYAAGGDVCCGCRPDVSSNPIIYVPSSQGIIKAVQ